MGLEAASAVYVVKPSLLETPEVPICTTSDAYKLELSSVRYVVDQLLYLARYWLLMTATTPYVVFVPQVVEPKRPLHIS